MPNLSRRLKQLDEELLDLGEEATLLEELDGFIAGLLVCPDLIKPGEWLPVIWNLDGGDLQPAFDDLGHANQILGLIMEHYNSVARTLMEHPDRYTPLFSVDTRNGDILWELWIEGFEKAVKSQPAAWQKLLNADAETAAAMRGVLALVDVACADQYMPRKDEDKINATTPDNIARWIVALMATRQLSATAQHRPTDLIHPNEKGRPQRSLPMWLRKEIQEVLRTSLD